MKMHTEVSYFEIPYRRSMLHYWYRALRTRLAFGSPTNERIGAPHIPFWGFLFALNLTRNGTCVFDVLMHLGFWDLLDGDYYVRGRWNWRWWRGYDRAMEEINKRHREDPDLSDLAPISGRQLVTDPSFRFHTWHRFGWWLEEATARVRMPRGT